jgi:hypothetical protein
VNRDGASQDVLPVSCLTDFRGDRGRNNLGRWRLKSGHRSGDIDHLTNRSGPPGSMQAPPSKQPGSESKKTMRWRSETAAFWRDALLVGIAARA